MEKKVTRKLQQSESWLQYLQNFMFSVSVDKGIAFVSIGRLPRVFVAIIIYLGK